MDAPAILAVVPAMVDVPVNFLPIEATWRATTLGRLTFPGRGLCPIVVTLAAEAPAASVAPEVLAVREVSVVPGVPVALEGSVVREASAALEAPVVRVVLAVPEGLAALEVLAAEVPEALAAEVREATLVADRRAATWAAPTWQPTGLLDPRRCQPIMRCVGMAAQDAPIKADATAPSAAISRAVSPKRQAIAAGPALAAADSGVVAASAEVEAVALAEAEAVALAVEAVAAVVADGVAAAVAAVADEAVAVELNEVVGRLFELNSRSVALRTGNSAMLNPINPDARELKFVRAPFALTALLVVALLPLAAALAGDPAQRVFPTPMAAVDALVAAAKQSDPMAALVPVLGPDAARILSSGDPVADDNALKNFLKRFNEMHRLAYNADAQVVLYLGADNWPLPIPLIKKGSGWIFDTPAGEKELVYRRIGANELYTIDVLDNLVDAQNEYATQARDESGVKQYAQKIISDKGKRNGLYWPAAPGEPESPIGPLIAEAVSQGYKRGAQGHPLPFHGYLFRVLPGQGKDAPGGAKSYIRNGKMTRGFAFLAYPVEYRSSGVMTFMVNQDGVVLEKDLGPGTAKIAQQMTRFEPDNTWAEATPEEPQPQVARPAATGGPAAAPQ